MLTLGYHDRMTQLLPNKDVAMLIWGNKITGDVLSPIRFHASKKLARKNLTTRRKKKWCHVQFDLVDWEHLDLTLKFKENMYRIWRSKQNSGFCGTRVQVGHYSGESLPDERCPNCGRQETAALLFTYVWCAYPRSLSLWSRSPHYSKLDYLVNQASSRHT